MINETVHATRVYVEIYQYQLHRWSVKFYNERTFIDFKEKNKGFDQIVINMGAPFPILNKKDDSDTGVEIKVKGEIQSRESIIGSRTKEILSLKDPEDFLLPDRKEELDRYKEMEKDERKVMEKLKELIRLQIIKVDLKGLVIGKLFKAEYIEIPAYSLSFENTQYPYNA